MISVELKKYCPYKSYCFSGEKCNYDSVFQLEHNIILLSMDIEPQPAQNQILPDLSLLCLINAYTLNLTKKK